MSYFSDRKPVPRGNAVVVHSSARAEMATADRDSFYVTHKKRAGLRLPMREFLPLFALFILFRVVVASDMGVAAYNAKMSHLSEGTKVERVVSKAMYLDPVSENAAKGLRKVLTFVSV